MLRCRIGGARSCQALSDGERRLVDVARGAEVALLNEHVADAVLCEGQHGPIGIERISPGQPTSDVEGRLIVVERAGEIALISQHVADLGVRLREEQLRDRIGGVGYRAAAQCGEDPAVETCAHGQGRARFKDLIQGEDQARGHVEWNGARAAVIRRIQETDDDRRAHGVIIVSACRHRLPERKRCPVEFFLAQRGVTEEACRFEPILVLQQMNHRLGLPQGIVAGQRQKVLGNHRMKLGFGYGERGESAPDSHAHESMGEIPLIEPAALPNLTPEQPPERRHAQLLPGFATEARQQVSKIGCPPPRSAHRDRPQECACQVRSEQLFSPIEGGTIEFQCVGWHRGHHVDHECLELVGGTSRIGTLGPGKVISVEHVQFFDRQDQPQWSGPRESVGTFLGQERVEHSRLERPMIAGANALCDCACFVAIERLNRQRFHARPFQNSPGRFPRHGCHDEPGVRRPRQRNPRHKSSARCRLELVDGIDQHHDPLS